MHPNSPRWIEVEPSPYEWEREALAFVREHLPDVEPYRAWTNFEFIAGDGAIYEVDLLVLAPRGVHLVEVKSKPGILRGDARTWLYDDSTGRVERRDNPLFLTNLKAKKLKSLLERQGAFRRRRELRVPFIHAAVFLSSTALDVRLPADARAHLYGRDEGGTSGLPGIVTSLTRISAQEHRAGLVRKIDRPTGDAVVTALDEIGLRPSTAHRRLGPYTLGELIEDGPGYQDFLADHTALGHHRRVRVYSAAGKPEAERRRLSLAAKREFTLLDGLEHPGVVRVREYADHDLGPALVFDYDPDAVRLDHFLEERGASLSLDERLGLVRQIAEALEHAHSQRLVHRTLSPRCVFVRDGAVVISDWQTGRRDQTMTSTATLADDLETLVAEETLLYMAPEALLAGHGRGEQVDVFSLAAIAFHIFSGRPPAASLPERFTLLERSGGLDLATAVDGTLPKLRDLVLEATRPDVSKRLDAIDLFLLGLDEIEEALTDPDAAEVLEPIEATAGDTLAGDLLVRRRLGKGGTAVAFLVETDAGPRVLKLALDPDRNDRIRDEGEILGKLDHPGVVALDDEVWVGERRGLLLRQVGTETLAQRIRQQGAVALEFLERWGSDLLDAVRYLEQQGITHRDIKPENIAIVERDQKERSRHLAVFDFSLSRAPLESIRAGTPPYLDPFLQIEGRGRWDAHAERFAAAVTLYEMATGTLPQWGDGESDPALLDAEASIDRTLLDPTVADRLAAFFERALRRDASQRYDTAEEMLSTWRDVFAGTGEPAVTTEAGEVDVGARVAEASEDSPVLVLGLSGRAISALERAGVRTARELAAFPPSRVTTLAGAGLETRREIARAAELLRERFEATPNEDPQREVHSLDLIDRALLPSRGWSDEDMAVVRALLDGGIEWPALSEIEARTHASRDAIEPALSRARNRWADTGALTRVREDLLRLLDAEGGMVAAPDVAATLLALRGSTSVGPARARIAGAVARAAIEAELARQQPRFEIGRTDGAPFLVRADELAELLGFAIALGERADALVSDGDLVPPVRAIDALRAVPVPAAFTGVSEQRLVRAAARASRDAAATARLELYRRGLHAERAIRHAGGALLGAARLTEDDVRERVAARFPEAAALPPRPALDRMLDAAGLGLEWRADEEGRYGYLPRAFESATSTSTILGRASTATRVGEPASPHQLEAARFEERVQAAIIAGGLRLLVAPRHRVAEAQAELERRFGLDAVSIESLLLDLMHAEAAKAGVNWEVVLQSDGLPDGPDWGILLRFVEAVIPHLADRLLQHDGTLLAVHAGVLARYNQLDILQRLRDRLAGPDELPLKGMLLLVPGDRQRPQPAVDGKVVPVITSNDWLGVPPAWISNLHRGRPAAVA